MYVCMNVCMCAVNRIVVTNHSSSRNNKMMIDSDLSKTNTARTRKPWVLSKYDDAVANNT